MIKLTTDTNRFWKTSRCMILTIDLIVFFFLGCDSNNNKLSKKMDGFINIELENSWWYRSNLDEYLSGSLIIIQGDSIFLPLVCRVSDSVYIINKNCLDVDFEKDSIIQSKMKSHSSLFHSDIMNSKGVWKILNTNPDSISIVAPNHPLNGSYSVSFLIDTIHSANKKQDNIFKIIIENDSTYLYCNKAGLFFGNKNFSEWKTEK